MVGDVFLKRDVLSSQKESRRENDKVIIHINKFFLIIYSITYVCDNSTITTKKDVNLKYTSYFL